MVQEYDPKRNLTTEQVLRREHAASAAARKTISGPIPFASDDTNPITKAPVTQSVTNASAELAMDPGKAYRFISTTALYFRMSRGTSAATTSDIYLPADQPIIIQSGTSWDRVSIIRATADGTAQLAELV